MRCNAEEYHIYGSVFCATACPVNQGEGCRQEENEVRQAAYLAWVEETQRIYRQTDKEKQAIAKILRASR